MKEKLIGGVLILIVCGIIFLANYNEVIFGTPIEAYQVSIDGVNIGTIESKDELYNLIDSEQTELKNKYGVSKVYPPDSLSVQKVYTYDNKIDNVQDIYNKVKEAKNFTIEGYVVTINYSDSILDNNDDEDVKVVPPKKIYILDKNIVKDSLYNTAASFIGKEQLKNYENETQTEIVDTGEIITSVFLDETITVRKDLISTNNTIIMNEAELSEYLLYGKLGSYKKYVIKAGESLESVAEEYYLSLEELLIANPQFEDGSVLLAAGDAINVAEVNPLIHVIYHKTNVEDLTVNYKTTYVDDNTKYTTYQETTTKGVKGVYRATQDVKYINGEIANIDVKKKDVLVQTVNEVITRGTKKKSSGGKSSSYPQYANQTGNSEWSWPTLSPFKIVSGFKMRTLYNQTKMHQGIDIVLTGAKSHGSPIYAVKDGEVVHVNYNTSKNEGKAVWILHDGNVYTQYMHLSRIDVNVGDKVKKEQKIGLMGCTGKCYGPHLHLGVWYGYPYREGVAKDPCKTIFKC